MNYQDVIRESMHPYFLERVQFMELKGIIDKYLKHNKEYIFDVMKHYYEKLHKSTDKYEVFQLEEEQIPMHCYDFEQSYLIGCFTYIFSVFEYDLYSILIKYSGKKVKKPKRNILSNINKAIYHKLPENLEIMFDTILTISKIRNCFVHNGGILNEKSTDIKEYIKKSPNKIKIDYNGNGNKIIYITDLFVSDTINYIQNYILELTDFLSKKK